jgi:hypothetical protein
VLFHSQGYKDAFPVTIQAGQLDLGTIMLEEDEISDQQKELNKAFRK